MFSLAIDSSLRGSDIIALNVSDVTVGGSVRDRVTIQQKKTKERVTFSLTKATQKIIGDMIDTDNMSFHSPLFSCHTPQYN